MEPSPIKNRITEMTGVDYPIVQAPMGWIARAQLASAVSNAGGLGIIETSLVTSMRLKAKSPRCVNSPINPSV